MPDRRLGGDRLLLAPGSSCCKAGQELLPPHSAGKVPDSGLSPNNSSVNEENAPASPHMLGNEPTDILCKFVTQDGIIV